MIKSAFEEAGQSPGYDGGIVVQEVVDPAQIARCRAQHERARRNTEWLEAHWPDLLPQARGKFLAVAGTEAFCADSPEAAWAWAATVHPEDNGAFVRYIRPQQGPRIYESLGQVASLR